MTGTHISPKLPDGRKKLHDTVLAESKLPLHEREYPKGSYARRSHKWFGRNFWRGEKPRLGEAFPDWGGTSLRAREREIEREHTRALFELARIIVREKIWSEFQRSTQHFNRVQRWSKRIGSACAALYVRKPTLLLAGLVGMGAAAGVWAAGLLLSILSSSAALISGLLILSFFVPAVRGALEKRKALQMTLMGEVQALRLNRVYRAKMCEKHGMGMM
jgi:hypothetical protein